MNRKLHEELQHHVHEELCSAVNQFSIRVKIHHLPVNDQSAEQQAKIIEARKRIPEPTWEEVITLLEKCRDEMDQCKEPFRKR